MCLIKFAQIKLLFYILNFSRFLLYFSKKKYNILQDLYKTKRKDIYLLFYSEYYNRINQLIFYNLQKIVLQ